MLDVIRALRYLGRQGIALQGHKGDDNFIQLMVALGAKDENIQDYLNKSLGNKCTSHDFPSELLEIIPTHPALLEKIEEIRPKRKNSLVSGNRPGEKFLSLTHPHSPMCIRMYTFNFENQTNKPKKQGYKKTK